MNLLDPKDPKSAESREARALGNIIYSEAAPLAAAVRSMNGADLAALATIERRLADDRRSAARATTDRRTDQ